MTSKTDACGLKKLTKSTMTLEAFLYQLQFRTKLQMYLN